MTRVAVAQLALRVGERAANLELTAGAVAAAATRGVDLLVMPELATSGYVFADLAEARSLAEPVDGRSNLRWAELSRQHDMVVVAGFCELGDDGLLYNSAVVIDRGEPRAVYRKVHLWGSESDVFATGSSGPAVIDTSVGRVGVMICYDLEFPEWTRMAALDGAEILAVPTNWPTASRPAGERPTEVLKAQVAAATNRIFLAVADRCGRERAVDWVGGSMILDPEGCPLAGPSLADLPAVLLADVDLGRARDKRYGEHNDVFADRRTDLYAAATRAASTRPAPPGRVGSAQPGGDQTGDEPALQG